MRSFIDTVDDDDLRQRLSRAINGRGAFRQFKNILVDHPDERARYFQYTNERQLGRARA